MSKFSEGFSSVEY